MDLPFLSVLCRVLRIPLQYISIKDKGKIGQLLRNWPRIDDARISVVTDGKSLAYCLTEHPANQFMAFSQGLAFLDWGTLASMACLSPLASSRYMSRALGQLSIIESISLVRSSPILASVQLQPSRFVLTLVLIIRSS